MLFSSNLSSNTVCLSAQIYYIKYVKLNILFFIHIYLETHFLKPKVYSQIMLKEGLAFPVPPSQG